MLKVSEYLPIGTVVKLKDGDKKLMIFGIAQTVNNPGEKPQEFDYIGVPYPEGNLGTDYQYMFQHSDIETIFFKGFNNAERQEFVQTVAEFYEKKH